MDRPKMWFTAIHIAKLAGVVSRTNEHAMKGHCSCADYYLEVLVPAHLALGVLSAVAGTR